MFKIYCKYIWVVGCPRSGTTFLTNYIGQYTERIYNEPWETYPLEDVESWQFPLCKNLVFKYCCNWKRVDKILKRFYPSKFIYMIRNPDDVVYSWMWPKEDSYPLRPFVEFGSLESKERFKNVIDQWAICAKNGLEFVENNKKLTKLIIYENIEDEIEGLGKFIKLPLKKTNLIFRNRNLNPEQLEKLHSFWNKFPEYLELRNSIINKVYK